MTYTLHIDSWGMIVYGFINVVSTCYYTFTVAVLYNIFIETRDLSTCNMFFSYRYSVDDSSTNTIS